MKRLLREEIKENESVMKAISVRGDGQNPSDLYLNETQRPDVAPGHVLIRTAFAGVNRPDVLQRKGSYPPPPGASPILGLEVSGVIETIRPPVNFGDDIGWKVGDEICALVNGGGYAEYVSVDIRHLLPVPRGLSLAEAASLPENILTVYANLMEHGALKAGETVLVHGGNSGIGAMTIQMGKAFGAKVIATARGADKCAFAQAMGADLVIDSDAEDFVAAVKAAGGADVVLDIVAGDFFAKNLACLNMGGRIVQVGFGKDAVVEVDLRRIMAKQAIVTGSMLRPRSPDEKARLTAKVHERVWPLIESGAIRPILTAEFDFAEADKAHAWIEKGDHKGKVVLRVSS
ncbi:NAD(P)H-quinone oxidoreductase [Asticcacaulis taihuensis]|uniref:Putative NAD(P)H quinone oxidoreductase, PIG3 family n=1 Tax=Asticcacaulis taihuensis TaxID=260084 RepID=A0A1G4QKX1_9CAUL|nr:NAD(P)H-quinone oxidoreductase [Asticcacaulis taihuensis]SCW45283.1 putative NAD(P)H quinone oxidoreductase, PIG3 family [Asticcacaulis taihuensis]